MKPDLSVRLPPGGPDENTEAARTQRPDDAECGFVRKIVAQERDRAIGTLFGEDGSDGAALVAAGAQHNPELKVEELKAIEFCKGFKDLKGAALDAFRHLAGLSAPVHDGAIGLVFKEAAQCVAAELLLEFLEPGLGLRGGLLEFASTIGIEAFRSVKTPGLKRRIEAKKRCDFLRWTACDEGHAGSALALNACERLADSGVGARCEAINPEGRERTIVIEQKSRAPSSGKPGKKSIDFFFRLWGHRSFAFPEV
jgi:hypothetical protein